MSNSFRWSKIKLVIFDCDGTLYSRTEMQKKRNKAFRFSFLSNLSQEKKVLEYYDILRQDITRSLANQIPIQDFEQCLCSNIALKTKLDDQTVNAILKKWLIDFPEENCRELRYPDIDTLFSTLRARNIKIGAFSDYPIEEKLRALDLEADFTAFATEADVDAPKPSPIGFKKILQEAQVEAGETVLITENIAIGCLLKNKLECQQVFLNTTGRKPEEIMRALQTRNVPVGQTVFIDSYDHLSKYIEFQVPIQTE